MPSGAMLMTTTEPWVSVEDVASGPDVVSPAASDAVSRSATWPGSSAEPSQADAPSIDPVPRQRQTSSVDRFTTRKVARMSHPPADGLDPAAAGSYARTFGPPSGRCGQRLSFYETGPERAHAGSRKALRGRAHGHRAIYRAI